MNKCIECQTEISKKYVRGYCIICYNRLLKNGKLNIINKNIPDKLNDIQIQILLGLMLGDGHLERRKVTHNTTLKVERSIKDKEFLLDNYNVFKNICSNIPPRFRKKDGEIKFINFNTRSVSLLNSFYNDWYDENGIKILPNSITLTPLTCAIWFCDDAFVYKNRNSFAIRFCTHSFSQEENIILCNNLNKILGSKFIVSKLKKDDKIYFIITGAHKSTLLFMNYIKEFLPQSMSRKIIDQNLFDKLA